MGRGSMCQRRCIRDILGPLRTTNPLMDRQFFMPVCMLNIHGEKKFAQHYLAWGARNSLSAQLMAKSHQKHFSFEKFAVNGEKVAKHICKGLS